MRKEFYSNLHYGHDGEGINTKQRKLCNALLRSARSAAGVCFAESIVYHRHNNCYQWYCKFEYVPGMALLKKEAFSFTLGIIQEKD